MSPDVWVPLLLIPLFIVVMWGTAYFSWRLGWAQGRRYGRDEAARAS